MARLKIYHRDLKPDNIMICFKKDKYFELNVLNNFAQLQADVDFEVVIIDFGLGWNLSVINANSTVVGNPLYWAPEGKGDDDEGWGHQNSDVFSVAAIVVSSLCPLPENKNFFDFKEKELIAHVEKSLSDSDSWEKVFKWVLPHMLVFKPDDWMSAAKVYEVLKDQKFMKGILKTKLDSLKEEFASKEWVFEEEKDTLYK